MMGSTWCTLPLAVLLLVQAVTCQQFDTVVGVGTFRKSIVGHPKSLRGATRDCANNGSHLIVIDSEQKKAYANTFMNTAGTYSGATNDRDIWVGVEVTGGTWKTVHGVNVDSVPFIHWCDTRPDDGACAVYSRNLQCHWDTDSCASAKKKLPYICEM